MRTKETTIELHNLPKRDKKEYEQLVHDSSTGDTNKFDPSKIGEGWAKDNEADIKEFHTPGFFKGLNEQALELYNRINNNSEEINGPNFG